MRIHGLSIVNKASYVSFLVSGTPHPDQNKYFSFRNFRNLVNDGLLSSEREVFPNEIKNEITVVKLQ